MKVLQPPGWPRPHGYANGVSVRGRLIFVAGMVGWNAAQQFQSDDLARQATQALRNIVAVLAEDGAGPEHIVRMTWYVVDRQEYFAAAETLGHAYREVIGHYHVAMTAIEVSGLIEDRARVEIEVTAVIPDS